jgi:hypothetical protein
MPPVISLLSLLLVHRCVNMNHVFNSDYVKKDYIISKTTIDRYVRNYVSMSDNVSLSLELSRTLRLSLS